MNRTRVIVVDDSLTVRMDIVDALVECGFDATPCRDLREARAALARGGVALVVLDVVLPDGDGLDLLREIRATPATRSMPVLLLSSEGAIGARVRGMGAGASEYVGKPYDLATLVARATALAKRTASVGPGTGKTILLVDDSITFRAHVREALESAGYAVVEASTGEEGLVAVASLRPSVLVVDGQLPGIDGRTVIRRIRSDASLRRTPCLLLTGSDSADDERHSLDAGADAFARKSEDFGILLARIEALLRRKRTGDSGTMPSLLAPKRVLAVDPSAVYLEQIAWQLREEGYDVVLARSGVDAITLLEAQEVDCILMGWSMPGMTGEEACRHIKNRAAWRDIPLLVLTAGDDREAMIDGMNAGADDVISKAADLGVLKARLRAQLRRKHIEDENRRVRDAMVRRESDARFQRLVHSNLIGVIAADREGHLSDANDAFLGMVGYDAAALGAQAIRLLEITPPEGRARMRAALDEALSNGAAPRFETEFVGPDGRRVPVVVGLICNEESGALVGFVLDRTEQKRAEESLRRTNEALASANRDLALEKARADRSNQFKTKFLANMSHELRTPLNAIIGFSELMVRGTVRPDMPEHAEFMGDILTSAKHLHRLINEVLDLSKVEAGKLDFFPEEIEAASVVAEVVAVLRPIAADRKITIDHDVDLDVGRVFLDPSRLKQVLYNFISNALKFSASGGRVTVRVLLEDPERLRIEVEDRGAGIAPDDLDRLFREFAQLEGSTGHRREGTGLGLALTKQLVEAQGGSVGVRSAIGRGSTFHAILPRRATRSM